ncbi:MAG: hypothetical protein CMN79_01240 [Spirochaetales bacterium]|nr:hypothetical protein [Spirochaetales bacterium]|tara:strand:+ start:1564 stop:2799 length:1236 start_codon:yes stop_codon:yes gene_type:complete
MRKALKAKFILFGDKEPLHDYSVIINKERIEKIIPNSEIDKSAYTVINLGDSVLMPGFVNAHIHLELNWVRKKLTSFNSFSSWLEQIINLKKQNNNREVITQSVQQSLKETINSGVTTIGQISSYSGLDFEEIVKSKIRTVYFFEIANSTISRINQHFFKNLRSLNKKSNGMFALKLFPHSIYSLDTVTLEEILTKGHNEKINLGIHLSESKDEVRLIQKKKNAFEDVIFPILERRPRIKIRGNSPLSYLHKLNKYKSNIVLVHMNNLLKEDLKILEKQKYPVVLCPRSNLFLNQKMADLNFFLNYEKTGIGTDGLSSNFSINFLDEIKFLYLHSKRFIKKNPEKIVLEKATLGGARALGIDKLVGTIEKNKKADLIAFRIKNNDPFMSVIDSNNNDLKLSIINGEIIKSQ